MWFSTLTPQSIIWIQIGNLLEGLTKDFVEVV